MTFFIFLRLYNKSILKQEHAENAAEKCCNRRFQSSKVAIFSSLLTCGGTLTLSESRISH